MRDPRVFEGNFWRSVVVLEDCWEWCGAYTRRGYGNLKRDGKTVRAHRASYEMYVGPVPEGLVLDHVCRNTRCVKPAHLRAVTQKQNVAAKVWTVTPEQRSAQAKRASDAAHGGWRPPTHCRHGHEMVPQTTLTDRRGHRRCKTCAHNRYRVRRAIERGEDRT